MKNNFLVGKVTYINENNIAIKFHSDIQQENIMFNKDFYSLVGYNNLFKIKHNNYFIIVKIVENKRYLDETAKNGKLSEVKETYCIPVGLIKNKIFEQGAFFIPSIFDDVYLLLQNEYDLICKNLISKDYNFPIGNIRYGYGKDYIFNINFKEFSAKHSAIFGITGSGKSNTLASILEKHMELHNNSILDINNKIILFDASGEFGNIEDKYKRQFQNCNILKFQFGQKNFRGIHYSLFNKENFKLLIGAIDEYEIRIVEDLFAKWNKCLDERTNLVDFDKSAEIFKLIAKNIKTTISNIYAGSGINSLKRNDILIFIDLIKKYLLEIYDVSSEIINNFLNFFSADNLILKSTSNSTSIYNKSKNSKLEFDDIEDHYSSIIKRVEVENLNLNFQKDFDGNLLFKVFVECSFKIATTFGITLADNISERYFHLKHDLNIFGEIKVAPDLDEEIINKTTVLFFDISNAGFMRENLVGFMINLLSNTKIEMRKNTRHFFIDEAHLYTNIQNVTTNTKSGQLTFNIIRKLAKEGRKFGNFLILSTQSPYDVDSEIFSQFGNFIVHKLNNDYDLKKVQSYTNINNDQVLKYIKQFSPGEAIFSSFNIPFIVFIYISRPRLEIISETIYLN